MEKLEIKKRTKMVDYEELSLACWKVDCKGVAPNTEIVLDTGMVALVRVGNTTKIMTHGTATVFSLLNPGKKTKLIGGKKAYDDCRIIAIDTTTDFTTQWGIAKNDAIIGFDEELGIECKIVANGTYSYKIEDFYAFASFLPVDEKVEISEAEVREILRAQTFGITSSYLSSQVSGKTLSECRAELSKYNESLKKALNNAVDSKGMTVTNVSCTLRYSPDHEAARATYNGVKAGVSINKVANEGRLDDIKVTDAEADIAVKLMNAQANANRAANQNHQPAGVSVACPRCGQLNTNTNYCEKCGEKFLAGGSNHKNN